MVHRFVERLRAFLTADRGEGDSVWEAIPRWQYDGRHVESGGLTRGEQETALADVEQQAEQRETGR
ncbi:hypothetical protein SAMN04487947_0298 [Halogeometricum rufum]|uniref:Uncharacterized protein n=1 Tax=Halogeometricum rufum TaxID=553469 RepID=A0A1I6FZE2_9EURY|nr:hypothetical protein [Halogeometricum rufum]SFR35308.1 hypothetical protein SAMN04487947_0298 [Halogeometricum rufum]